MSAAPLLRMNQGDRGEARSYYCMHFVAAELGFFAAEGVDVAFTWTDSRGDGIHGGQLPAVIDGSADLAIGGPMLVMRMAEEDGPKLAAFCAAVAANPWVLAAASPRPCFRLADLAGARVRDIAGIGTATLTVRWLLRQLGLHDVQLEPGGGDEAADIDAVASGAVEYGLHSLHALAPAVCAGRLVVVTDLAGPTGPVPWSAYIAQRQRLATHPAAYAAFARAIGRALAWIAVTPAAEIAGLVSRHYPGYPEAALRLAIDGYKTSGAFAEGPLISRTSHDHFARIMAEAGWLKAPVAYERVVAIPGTSKGVPTWTP